MFRDAMRLTRQLRERRSLAGCERAAEFAWKRTAAATVSVYREAPWLRAKPPGVPEYTDKHIRRDQVAATSERPPYRMLLKCCSGRARRRGLHARHQDPHDEALRAVTGTLRMGRWAVAEEALDAWDERDH